MSAVSRIRMLRARWGYNDYLILMSTSSARGSIKNGYCGRISMGNF